MRFPGANPRGRQYTYSRGTVATDDAVARIGLQADGQPPISPLPLVGQRVGVLPAGH